MAGIELGPDQWQRLKPLLTEAVRLAPGERSAFLGRHLGSDGVLRSYALEMLRLYDQSSRAFTATNRDQSSTDAITGPATPPLEAERAIGHYRVIRKLGEGGMGRVYLAEDQRLGRRVALKLLDPSAALTRGSQRSQVIAESRSIAVLNHPGIVTLYDVFEEDEELLLVMEYVEGRPLSNAIAAGPIPTPFALRLIEQIADTVAYAHARGVLHCDLKPSNIHLLPTGAIKILDFGLARILTDAEERDAGQPRVVGTLGYLSPEQLSFRAPTAASDVYALGVVSYELLTGAPPFSREGDAQMLFDTVSTTPSPPSVSTPGLPAGVDDIVLRCLAKNPRERFQAHELAAAIRQLTSPAPSAASEPARDVQTRQSAATWRPATRHPLSLALFGGLCLLAVVLGIAMSWTGAWPSAWLWRATPTSTPAHDAPIVSLAILPSIGSLQSAEDTAMGRAIPSLLRAALSRERNLNVLLLDDEAADAATAPQAAVKALGATLGVRCLLSSQNRQHNVEVELFSGDRADRVFHATVPFDAQSPPRTFEQVFLAVDRGLTPHLRRAPPAESGTAAVQLLPSGLALSHFTEALEMLDRADVAGNVQRAITLLESATEKDPSSALAHAALARAQWMNFRETRSEESARRATASVVTALTLSNELLPVKLTAAIIQRGTGEIDRAESTLREAMASSPASDEAHRMLGELLAAKDRHRDAQSEFDTAIALRPLYWRNHRAKGLAYYEAGDYESAARTFTRVTELQPDSAFGLQMLGAALHQLGRYDEALASYEKALKLGPTAAGWSNIAKLHYDNHRYDEAVAAYKAASAIRESSPVTWRSLGDVYDVMGRRADARDAYLRAEDYAARATRVNPSDAANLSTLAVIHAKLGRHKEAIAEADRAVTLAPADRAVHFRRAVVLMLASQRESAQLAVDRAIALGYSLSEARLDRDLRGLKFDAQ